jgi:hypothetical protein
MLVELCGAIRDGVTIMMDAIGISMRNNEGQ